jgi:large subunit ribosomal protein L22
MKRIRPAPMGRAFRVVKRTAHLTVHVTERPMEIETLAAPAAKGRGQEQAKPAAPAAEAKKAAPRKRAAPARKKAPAKKAAKGKDKGKKN